MLARPACLHTQPWGVGITVPDEGVSPREVKQPAREEQREEKNPPALALDSALTPAVYRIPSPRGPARGAPLIPTATLPGYLLADGAWSLHSPASAVRSPNQSRRRTSIGASRGSEGIQACVGPRTAGRAGWRCGGLGSAHGVLTWLQRTPAEVGSCPAAPGQTSPAGRRSPTEG